MTILLITNAMYHIRYTNGEYEFKRKNPHGLITAKHRLHQPPWLCLEEYVAKGTIAVETCVHQPCSWRGAPNISTVISRFIHLNVSVEKDVRHVFVRTFVHEAPGVSFI